MKILIAPDSYKECLTAREVAGAIIKGIKRVLPDAECLSLPVADGGEGTIDAILGTVQGKRIRKEVTGPAGKKTRACYGIIKDGRVALIEMAEASGLMLIDRNRRNPSMTSSYGTGELIIDALDKGIEKMIIGLGGSATVDCGAGMAQALGYRFYDVEGNLIRKKITGGMLDRISGIDKTGILPGIRKTRITAASDVENKLCGRNGAARIFGPQKGATPEMVEMLERNLRHFTGVVKKDLGMDILNIKGGGAAGGMGAGLAAFTNAKMKSGIDLVLKTIKFEKKAAGVDLIITGEGQIDAQSSTGKALSGISAIGKKLGVPVVAIGGNIGDDAHRLFAKGIDGLAGSVARDMPRETAINHAGEYIANAAERTIRLILLGNKIKRLKVKG